MSSNAGQTVREILGRKKASVRQAPLDPGSPSWDDILDWSWEELVRRAKGRVRGYKTLKKLLSSGEYDR